MSWFIGRTEALSNPDGARRKALDRLRREAASQEPYRGLPWMTREQLLNVRDLQAVLVETRVGDLLDAAEAGVTAGLHVHLDKPGALNHAEFKTMRQEAERRNLTVQMGYMLRYNPAFELLFRAVRAFRKHFGERAEGVSDGH